jgi:superfamily II RNA helicase
MSKYLRVITDPYVNSNIDTNPPIKFKFECDHFQKHSFHCISKDENVLVTAHTGSGKTAIAKYAIAHYVRKKKKVIYTSPIKALSNQKYKELREQFEEDFGITVGLMTGDNKINPDADCVIMTTEILRNALYDITELTKRCPEDEKYIYFEENFIKNIGCVIFDEVHYINDKSRGHVWEETIILLDPSVTLVMLSATIDKAEDFASWVGNNKQKIVNLIPTNHRVVPLEHFIYTDKNLIKILTKKEKFKDSNFDLACRFYRNLNRNRGYKNKIYLINESVKFLKEKNLLQAIYFSFSRRNCEKYAKMITISLLSLYEIRDVETIFYKYMHEHEDKYLGLTQYHTIKQLIVKGVGFHHSGLLSILKEIIEIIFQKGLIKVLFATETFAVGVNMPTRTIVFTELEKPTDGEKRFLHTAEYKQMSGRAGRRGIDTFGFVIILPLYDFPYKEELKSVMLGKVPHIESKFNINYSFILKIIQSNTKNMDDFINGSMFNKDNNNIIQQLQKELIIAQNNISGYTFDQNDVDNLDKYLRYDKIEEQYFETGFRLNKKQIKDKQRLMRELSKNNDFKTLYSKYNEFCFNKKCLADIQQNIYDVTKFVSIKTDKFVSFLKTFDYIKQSSVNNTLSFGDVTMKGLLASQINECNPLILTEMIVQHVFDDLAPEEIVAVLGLFIDDTRKDDKFTFNSIKCSKNVKNVINSVHCIINDFITEEKRLDIDNYLYDFWEIDYTFVEPAYIWANGSTFNEIRDLIDVYEGNFIRIILKLNSIVQNLFSLNQIYGNHKLVPQLEQIEEKIIRDIVSVSSLYIST